MKELLDKNSLDQEQAYALCSYLGMEINLLEISGREVDLPYPFSPKEMIQDELVFFPGSFNPWHDGHSACLINCADKPIAIIPDHNPWKEVRLENPWDEVVHIKENISPLSDRNIFIYPGFLASNEKNPTSSWLPHVNVKKKWLLMGDDLFLGLHQWQDVDKVLNCLHGIYVCPRGETKEKLEEQRDKFKKSYSLEILFLEHHEFEDLSSTQLREK